MMGIFGIIFMTFPLTGADIYDIKHPGNNLIAAMPEKPEYDPVGPCWPQENVSWHLDPCRTIYAPQRRP